jgi:hypothetical protein
MEVVPFSLLSPAGWKEGWERRAGVVRAFLDPFSGAVYHSLYLHPVERLSAREVK